MTAKSTIGAHDRLPVTAAHPMSTGAAPAAPVTTMLLLQLRPSRHRV
jgi:hypothetical protein